jgi:Ni,Fe-hydrogenase I large subunit
MEDIQNLAGIVEELKDKLTDTQYKDILELSKKIYDKKNQKYVKCLLITNKMLKYQDDHDDDDDDDGSIETLNQFSHYDGCDFPCKIVITKEMETIEKIYKVSEFSWSCDLEEKSDISTNSYKILKEKKYINFHNKYVIVYLCDM